MGAAEGSIARGETACRGEHFLLPPLMVALKLLELGKRAVSNPLLLAGRHVVIATPTASGKTESYKPIILEPPPGRPDGLTALTGTQAQLYIYNAFPGGLGFAEQIYSEPEALLAAALARLEGCTCTDDEGCLVCLKYFRCRQFNDALSKLAGRYLLRLALGQPVAPVLSDLADYVQTTVPRALIAMRPSG